MATISRFQARRVARWLIAALLFSVLHPAFAAGLAVAQGTNGLVQICTGAGMAWVRIAEPSAQPGDALAAQELTQDLTQERTQERIQERTPDVAPDVALGDPPADNDTAASASPCPFCLGAALAPGGLGDQGLAVEWPQQASPAPASPPSFAPACARVILDAPMRGPPGAPDIA